MPSQLNITSIPSSRVDFIDQRTGLMSREWYRFFLNLYNLTGAGNNPTSLDDLQVGPPTGGGEGNAGTVTSVAMTVPTGLTVTGSPITSAGTLAVSYASGYSIPTTTKQAQWDMAYSERLEWDGGATNLVASTGRTSLGATTIGGNMFTLTNPSAITFPRFNADNTISALDAASFRAAIGAGTGGGSVTSVATAGTVNGLTLTGGPITTTGTITLGGTLDLSSPPTIGNTTPNTGAFTTLSASSTVSGVGFSDYLASPPAIGGTTPAAGTFTTLTANSTFQAGKSSANYQQIVGAATTLAPVLSVLGSDTNVALAIKTQGTGAIDLAAGSRGVNISNGGTVTAITRTNAGSGYTSIPSITISAPTTAGGVQATVTGTQFGATTATIQSGGTGYTVNDVITLVGGTLGGASAATYTVTAVSGGVITAVSPLNFAAYTALPTNPVSVTGGTGSGATLNVTYYFATTSISNAGSGYVEQPTVTFSGGGGSGAAAYATVGSGSVIRALGVTGTQALDIYTPSGITSSIPALRFRDSSGSDSYPMIWNFTGSANIISQGTTNANLRVGSNGSGAVQFTTSGTGQVEQLRVTHTASAVNYVQVTGAATGAGPTISAQGSDSQVRMTITTKSSQDLFLNTGATGGWVRISPAGAEVLRVVNVSSNVNYFVATGSAAGSAPAFSVNGSDTNIDLTLTPKGTGVLKTTAVTNIGAGTVLAGATNPLVAMTGNTNQYVQSYIINNNAGASASSDFVAYANNSTDSHGWADMGFTSSVYADATYTVTGPNEAYLFGSAPSGAGATGNLVYATDSTGSANAHQFYVGGFTQAKGAWKAQIDSTGLKATQVNATNGLLVNSMTVSASYTVASGDSAMSVGPITVSSGASVTISSGSRWVIM